MSGYAGRRGPNASQYIANLNMIHSPQDMTLQQDGGFSFEDDLAMFTNAQFFDFDLGETVDGSAANVNRSKEQAGATGTGLRLDGDYQMAHFPGFQTLLDDASNIVLDPVLKPTANASYNKQAPAAASPSTPTSTVAATPGPQNRPTPPSSSSSSKRKSDSISATPASLEEASRLAAEEDKRRRNTAASARFRVKKKQREQTLERTAKEMTEKVGQLEARIGQLETENKWLKNLITEKNGNRDDVTDMWRKFTRDRAASPLPSSATALRSPAEKKDGVGTAAAKS